MLEEGIKSESQEASSEEPMKELSLLNISDSSDNSPVMPFSTEEYITLKRIDLLWELEDAILRATQSKFMVQDVYIGVSSPPANPEERLIVIYDWDAANEVIDRIAFYLLVAFFYANQPVLLQLYRRG